MKDSSVLPYLLRLYATDGGLPTELAAHALMHTASKLARDNRILMENKIAITVLSKLRHDQTWSNTVTGYSAKLLAYLTHSPCNRRSLLKLGVLHLLLPGLVAGTKDAQFGLVYTLRNLTSDDGPHQCDPEPIKLQLAADSRFFPVVLRLLDCAEYDPLTTARAGEAVENFMQLGPRAPENGRCSCGQLIESICVLGCTVRG
jgi:hypothetical protein